METEEVFEARGDLVQHPDVGAGGEELLAVPPDHDDVRFFGHPGVEDRLVQLAHHFVGVGVGRWVVERDDRETILHFIIDQHFFRGSGSAGPGGQSGCHDDYPPWVATNRVA